MTFGWEMSLKKRHDLTLKEKVDIVGVYNNEKPSVRDLSKRFNIGKTQAADIVKNRTELLNKWHSNLDANRKRSFLKPQGLKVDTLCYEWVVEVRNKGMPVSGRIVRAKAKEIAESLGYEKFNASSGWLQKFCNRHNFKFKATSGEASSVNLQEVDSSLNKVPSLEKNNSSNDILNADETDLFFRASPFTVNGVRGFDKSISVSDAVYFIKTACQKISEETVKNCIHHAGINCDIKNENLLTNGFSTEDDQSSSMCPESKIMNIQSLGQFINMNNPLLLEDDEPSVTPTRVKVETEIAPFSGESDEGLYNYTKNNVTNYSEAISAIRDVKEFVKNTGESKAMDSLTELELYFQDRMSKTNTN